MPKHVDLSGQTINFWKINKYLGGNKYSCTCLVCNNEYEVYGSKIKKGISKSCASCASKINGEKQRIKLEGTTVNEWTVEKYLGYGKYLCRCKCNNTAEIEAYQLLNNKTHRCKECNDKLLQDTRREKLEDTKIGELYVTEYLGDSMYKCICSCGEDYICHAYGLRNNKYPMCTKCLKLKHKNNYRETMFNRYGDIASSKIDNPREVWQLEIRELLKNYDVLYNNKTAIYPMELDIYIPSHKIAIEFNGNYWHSELEKEKDYHQNKTILCAKQGIHLIHIFEYEWNDKVKKEKIIKYIYSCLDKPNFTRIYARNTEVKLVSKDEEKEFLERNHLQNYVHATVILGLYFKNKLLALMSFSKPRFNNEFQYEMIRLAFDNNTIIVGGSKKLFNYFISNYNPKSIISYCDISKFTGSVYLSLGFKTSQKEITSPNYVWVNFKNNEVLPRYKTMKHRLIELGLGTEEQTENEIMHNHGYYKIYDCGNLKFTWYKEDNQG